MRPYRLIPSEERLRIYNVEESRHGGGEIWLSSRISENLKVDSEFAPGMSYIVNGMHMTFYCSLMIYSECPWQAESTELLFDLWMTLLFIRVTQVHCPETMFNNAANVQLIRKNDHSTNWNQDGSRPLFYTRN